MGRSERKLDAEGESIRSRGPSMPREMPRLGVVGAGWKEKKEAGEKIARPKEKE